MTILSHHISARFARILVLQTMEFVSVDQSEFQKLEIGLKKLMLKDSKEGVSVMQKRVRYNWLRIIVISIIVVSLIYGIFIVKNMSKLLSENSELKKQNTELTKQKKSLENELKNVNKPEYIEEQAKLQLKLIKPGETLFILGEENALPGYEEKQNKEKDN